MTDKPPPICRCVGIHAEDCPIPKDERFANPPAREKQDVAPEDVGDALALLGLK